jgi:2-polyprenyl-3-methyl-5-hydroxy-6-metoxy-1,4-benzoquinol methylase
MVEADTIRSDFDKLALLDAEGWSHNSHYHTYLLKQIPENCKDALEIGCGTGSFSRLLAQKADRVLALDLSPEMIQLAKQRSAEYPNIDYRIADVMDWDFPKESFDCIASIATLHHLPFASVVKRMKSGLKINGILMILDLYQPESIRDLLINLGAVPVHLILKLKNTGRLRDPKEIREAWAEHGKHDTYLRVSQVRRLCEDLLPEAIINQHLLWRYSIVWQKPKGNPL